SSYPSCGSRCGRAGASEHPTVRGEVDTEQLGGDPIALHIAVADYLRDRLLQRTLAALREAAGRAQARRVELLPHPRRGTVEERRLDERRWVELVARPEAVQHARRAEHERRLRGVPTLRIRHLSEHLVRNRPPGELSDSDQEPAPIAHELLVREREHVVGAE